MLKQSNKALSTALALLFLLAAATILLYPVFAGQGSFCINPDNLHQAYPFFYKLSASLHHGYLPVWDANTYGGKNFSGEFQTGIFYPLNVLWCLLFGSAAGIDVYWLDVLVALHFFICMAGMYCLGRVFRLSQAAAVSAALIFTFTGVVSARAGGQTCIFFGLTLLPWPVYFCSKYYWVQRRKKYLIFAGLLSGLQILAGHIQPFFHTFLINGLIIMLAEYRSRRDGRSFLLSAATNISLLLLFAFLIALPQIYYAAQYLSHAYRWVGADSPVAPGEKLPLSVYRYKYIITLSNLANLLGRNYAEPEDGNMIYMGVLPLFLFIVFLVKNKLLKLEEQQLFLKKILSIILIIGTLSVLGYLTFFYLILYHIPFVSQVRQLGRYSILISFSASLICGLAISNISEIKRSLFQKNPDLKFYLLSLLCLNALFLVFFEQKTIPRNVSIPFLSGFLFFLLLLRVRKTDIIPIIAVVFIFTDLLLNKVEYQPTGSPFYPTVYYKKNRIIDTLETTYGKYRVTFEIQNDDLLRRNIGDIYPIQTKLGYGATMNKSYFDFIGAGWDLNSEVNDLLNIRYVVTDKALDSNFLYRDSAAHLKLYERKHYYPRAYWKKQLGMQGPSIEEENKGAIRQTAYSDGYQRIEIDCQEPDTLIVSENYYPGWKCYDNGERTEIFPAHIKNYPPLFRSVAITKGHHVIEFRYNKVFYWF